VNNLEDRLRDAYRAAADTVDPGRIRGLREHALRPASRPGRGAAFAPLAVAAAVVAVVLTTALLGSGALSRNHLGHSVHPGHPAAARRPAAGPAAHPTPGLPRFVIATTPSEFKVIDTYTWATVAQVPAPSGQAFAGVAGAADDQAFVLAAMPAQQSACHAWLYEVRLGRNGQPGSLSLLASDMNWLPTSIAISGDASTVAYSFVHCATGSATRTLPGSAPIGDINVMKLGTRQVRQWSYDLSEDYTRDLSLSADGSLVGFSSFLDAPLGTVPPTVGRVLSASAQPGTVVQRGKVLFQLTPANATDSGQVTLSADGRTMYAFRAATHTLAAYDTSSGKRIRVVTTSPDIGSMLAAAGHYLLLTSTHPGGSSDGKVTMSWIDVTSGAITKLPVSLPASTGSDAAPSLGL
jgi:hypothetical protein